MTSENYSTAFLKGFPSTARFLQSRGASRDEAEEVAQAAWVKGWERRGQLRQPGSVGLWVNTIALNEFRRAVRQRSVYSQLGEVCGEVGVNVAAMDAEAILKRCLPRDQILFKHQLQGHTTEEIATLLGVSQTATRIRLLRARRAARCQAGLKPLIGLRKSA